MKNKNIFLLALLVFICLTGCSGNDIRKHSSSSGKDIVPELADLPSEGPAEEIRDSFSFGYVSESDEGNMDTYIYNKEYIEVPFWLEVKADTGRDVGFLVFINGVLQNYSIKEEKDRKEDTMQLFSLDKCEEKKYTFLIRPDIGCKGEKVGIYICGIMYPSFQPESEKSPSYQYFGKLSQVVPQQVYFDKEVSGNNISFVKSIDGMKISEEVINAIKMFSVKSVEETLDNSVYVQLYQKSINETVIKAENGKVRLKLKLYGGVEGKYRTTIFVNNKPVQIDGKDAVESILSVKKMSEYEFELDLSKYGKMNTIYAITVPADDAYLEIIRRCEKSDSRLLVNE